MGFVRGSRSLLRLVLALLLAGLLAACQRTLFESPPLASDTCDDALHGRWLSLASRPEETGELDVTIAPDCSFSVIERRQEGPRESDRGRLRSTRADGVSYLWVDADWANRSFEVEATALDRPGQVYLYAYRLARDELQLAAPPHKALAHRVIDRDIAGDVLAVGDDIVVRIAGDAEATRALLRRLRPFRFDEPLRFERADEAAAK